MLLDVVACCCAKFETGQTFRPVQTDATLLADNSQLFLRPFALSLKLEVNLNFNLAQMATSFIFFRSYSNEPYYPCS